MTRTSTVVRLRSRGGSEPACAAATVTAHEGVLELSTSSGTRTLRVGSDVVTARFDDGVGLAGRLALQGPTGPVAVLDLDDWVPPYVRASGHCRGGIEDALVWTGVQALADTAGVPVTRGAVPAPADVVPCPKGRRRPLLAATVALSLAGVTFLGSVIAELTTDVGTTTSTAVAVVMTALAFLLWLDHVARSWRGRRLPAGDGLVPRPSVPVTRRFLRDARLVLSPAQGPLEEITVRDGGRVQYRVDGPASVLGVRRAVVVTPPGARLPERVDLVDGLGRQVVRLPWAEWFGAGEEGLDRLTARGVTLERVQAPSLGTAVGLLAPRSLPLTGRLFEMPGAFDLDPMVRLAGAATGLPIVLGLAVEGGSVLVLLGALTGVFLFGPMVAGLLALPWLERARPRS